MTYTSEIIIDSALTKVDRSIGPGPMGAAKGPPTGYAFIKMKDISLELKQDFYNLASKLLSGKYGTMTFFHIKDSKYVARVEAHYHNEPPAHATIQEKNKYPKPWGWHKGVTIYQSIDSKKILNSDSIGYSRSDSRAAIIKRIREILYLISYK